ncbi:MAG: envelope stress response membrane protein PspB [Vibrio sp.]
MSGFFAAPLIVFFIFVAPLWLILHYRSKNKINQGLSSDEKERLTEMTQRAESLQSRIETLEKILDVSTPGWRRSDGEK